MDRHRRANHRLWLFHGVTLVVALMLIGSLFREQFINRQAYVEREERQALRRIVQPGPRGNIFDRNGELLVGNQARFTAMVYLRTLRQEFRGEFIRRVRSLREAEAAGLPVGEVNRSDVIWDGRTAVIQRHLDEIGTILGRKMAITRREVEQHYNRRLLMPLYLVRDLSESDYARLIDRLPSDSPVLVQTRVARFYPYGSAAAHVLGYVGADDERDVDDLPGDDLTTFHHGGLRGRSGLELQFDDLLSGRPGGEIWRVDPLGFQYERVYARPPIPGEDLQITIDIGLQVVAERALRDYRGAVVALKVGTGEVLALASSPSYDLNDMTPFIPSEVYQAVEESGGWLNRAIQGLYPPGSTFKIVPAVAALSAGLLDPDEILICGGTYRVGNRLFPEHFRPGFGEVDLRRSLQVSSNVYYYQVGLRLGIARIAAMARAFGFDHPTGIELPFETRRMVVPDREWKRATGRGSWFPGDTANVSIGQGDLLVTPLQMAAFTASLARGETRTRSTLQMSGVAAGNRHPGEPLPISSDHLAAIFEGMEAAVEDGTARRAGIPGVRVAGKTGTAQVRPGGRPTTLAWFIGFAPVDSPRIAVAVMVEGVPDEDPFHGGTTAAPIARQLFEYHLRSESSARVGSSFN